MRLIRICPIDCWYPMAFEFYWYIYTLMADLVRIFIFNMLFLYIYCYVYLFYKLYIVLQTKQPQNVDTGLIIIHTHSVSAPVHYGSISSFRDPYQHQRRLCVRNQIILFIPLVEEVVLMGNGCIVTSYHSSLIRRVCV
jgi:hypothetical protein